MSKKQVFALFLSLILFLISCAYNPKQNSLDVVSSNTSTDMMYLYVIADLKTFDNNYNLCSENIIKHCVNNDFPSTKSVKPQSLIVFPILTAYPLYRTPFILSLFTVHHFVHHLFKKLHHFTIIYDKLVFFSSLKESRKLQCFQHFLSLLFINDLKNIEF